MKNIIAAATIALGLTLAAVAPAKAMGADECSPWAEITGHVATLRDQGVGPQDVYDVLMGAGIDEDAAVILLKLVYVDAPDASPKQLQDTFFMSCVSEAV